MNAASQQTKDSELCNILSVNIEMKINFRATIYNTISLKLSTINNTGYLWIIIGITELAGRPVMVEQLGGFD
jgi:hypothetical protein